MSAELIIGNGLKMGDGVTLGHRPSRSATTVLTLGAGVRLRSGTVIYAGSKIGSHFETGHHVVIREGGTGIGDAVSVRSTTVVDHGCVIGNRVKIHCNCYLTQFTKLENDVFLAPGVTVPNDLFPGQAESVSAMAGPLIRAGAQIGVNATILPHVTIGPAPSSARVRWSPEKSPRERWPMATRRSRAATSRSSRASRPACARPTRPVWRRRHIRQPPRTTTDNR
jgi:UDP-3-O-[3-hydroxymyristoyl] glucosamine N-acyltransferase